MSTEISSVTYYMIVWKHGDTLGVPNPGDTHWTARGKAVRACKRMNKDDNISFKGKYVVVEVTGSWSMEES